jgi:hypothetical protein
LKLFDSHKDIAQRWRIREGFGQLKKFQLLDPTDYCEGVAMHWIYKTLKSELIEAILSLLHGTTAPHVIAILTQKSMLFVICKNASVTRTTEPLHLIAKTVSKVNIGEFSCITTEPKFSGFPFFCF